MTDEEKKYFWLCRVCDNLIIACFGFFFLFLFCGLSAYVLFSQTLAFASIFLIFVFAILSISFLFFESKRITLENEIKHQVKFW